MPLRSHPMVGPRVFTLDEANALIPELETAFEEIDGVRDQLRAAKIKLSALEMIWGQELQKPDCPDHKEAGSLVEQLRNLEQEIGAVLQRLGELGATVKDVHAGLVDLYHVRDSLLVFLCWKREEQEFAAWHHVDSGFADRKAL